MALPTPDSFLDGNGINGNDSWASILQQSPLALEPVSPAQSGTISLKSARFWELIFSSDANASRFGPVPSGVSNASAQNLNQDAVLGLVNPTAPPLSVDFSMILVAFDITPENSSSILASFLSQLDPENSLVLQLNATSDDRSALWALSGPQYRTVVQITFDIPPESLSRIETFINQEYGLALQLLPSRPRMAFRTITSYTPDPTTPESLEMFSIYDIVVSVQVDGFDVALLFTPAGLSVRMSNPYGHPAPPGSVFTRLSQSVLQQITANAPDAAALPDPNLGGAFNTFLSEIELYYLTLGKADVRPGDTTSGSPSLVWQIKLIANWQGSPGFAVLLQYDSNTSSLLGRLLFNTDQPDPAAKRQYDYDWQVDLSRATTKTLPPPPLDLWKLFNPSAVGPPQIPHEVNQAMISYKRDPSDGGYTFAFSTTIFASSSTSTPSKDRNSAPDGFVWDMISVKALVKSSNSPPLVSMAIFSEMSLNPPPGSSYPAAKLLVNASYTAPKSWRIYARVDNLSFGLLYHFFNRDVQDSAVGVLGKLQVKRLEVLYTYNALGEASSFYMTAIIMLGDGLELDMIYEYASPLLLEGDEPAAQISQSESDISTPRDPLRPNGQTANWKFEAVLGSTEPNSTVGTIISKLAPNADFLPNFVRDIPVNSISGGDAAVKLILRGGDTVDEASGASGTYTAVSLSISIGHVNLTFVSLDQSLNSDGPKRVLRIRVDKIPLINDVPLINELPPPFDELLYLWLDDPTTGLMESELDMINDELAEMNIPKIAVKDNNKADPSLPVMMPGHHFMILEKGTVVLDHNFSQSSEEGEEDGEGDVDGDEEDGDSEPSHDPAVVSASGELVLRPLAATTTNDNPPATKGALDKQFPFISITAISLFFRNGTLGIEIDGTVRLGPISFSVIKLDLGLDISGATLNDLSGVKPVATLHGLDVQLDSPPITLAGVFIHESAPGLESYKGGVSLGFEQWKFLAVGEYAVVDGGAFKSVFVYAKLEGPLMTLGFATVSGVRMGLGYNSLVRSPTIQELPVFPFLNDSVDSDHGGSPLEIITAMTEGSGGRQPWVSRKNDSYWVAAGVTLTAFGMLSVTAVLMLGIRDSGFVISIFADGIAQVPCNVAADATLFYVEIGMLAELNTVDGYFTVQAALAPSSHVLVPACRLTGGFAMVNWFKPNTHAGDFVFTVGGYHRAYSPPQWYPKVDRLGIAFTLGGMINVTGNAYFAITPKCVMGGGGLHMGLEVGPVSAWLDASVDVFVQFKPFHYTADLMVAVGCAISIDVWFVHVRITASVGAALHIEGPDPFGGTANVDFYLFSFTIHFGAGLIPPPPASLLEFYDMVAVPGPTSDNPESGSGDVNPTESRLKFTLTSGLFPQPLPPSSSGGSFPDSGASKPWTVKTGKFACDINVDFALSSAYLVVDADNLNVETGEGISTILTSSGSPSFGDFYSKPMHVYNPISSVMGISIWKIDIGGTRTLVQGFRATLIFRDVPTALWAAYSTAEDPATPNNSVPPNLTDNHDPTMSLCMGISLTSPDPAAPASTIEDFDAAAAFRATIPEGPYHLPDVEPAPTAFLADEELLAGEAPSVRWDTFSEDWTAAAQKGKTFLGVVGDDGTQSEGMLKMAAHWLGWDQRGPNNGSTSATVGAVTKAPWVLQADLPLVLVKELGVEYAVLPRETKVGA